MSWTDNYLPPDASLWTGRSVAPGLPPQYWYQVVGLLDLRKPLPDLTGASVLIGYAVDEGVRRNQGRDGAAEGPDAARLQLGRLANHLAGRKVLDAGNIVCPDGNLERAQEAISICVEQLVRAGARPIAIGGGHDLAYAHFRGLYRAKGGRGKHFGVLNFDAHLDLRDPVEGPTSGTPFHQIMDEFGDYATYLAVGIQRVANTPGLFETAERFGVEIILDSAVADGTVDVFQRIGAFIRCVDFLYVTVDMDCFSGGAAPGVSAPNPVGLAPESVLGYLRSLGSSYKVIGMDIAEFCPKYDRDGLTGRLVSRLVEGMIWQT